MKYCGVILLVALGCGLACKETDLIVVEGMAVVANELRKGIKNIMQEFGKFNETLLSFNETVGESLVNYSYNHCLQKFLVEFEESLAEYNCTEFKMKLYGIEDDYYKDIERDIINKTIETEKLAIEQKLNGSCYLEIFGGQFSDLTSNLVHQINDSMRIVQEELNRKLNTTSTSLRIIGAEIKSEILKCNQNEFSEFCIAEFFSIRRTVILELLNITSTLLDVSNHFTNTLKSQQSDKLIELKYQDLNVKLSKCSILK